MGEQIFGIFVLFILLGMIYLAFIYKPEENKERNGNPNQFKSNAGEEALQNAIKNAAISMEFVTANFDEFAKLRQQNDSLIAMNFVWLEVAVIIAKERVNKGIDEAEFANLIFLAGQDIGDSNSSSHYTEQQKDVFFGCVNAYLSSIGKFIESAKSSSIDPGPGYILLKHIMESIEGKNNLSDEIVGKCLLVGSELSTSILQYIFEDLPLTKKSESSTEFLSQRLDDAAVNCGVPLKEFLMTYKSYLATLQGTSNWNDDIDSNAIKLNILTQEEVSSAKTNIKQAALNRAIYRFKSFKSM